LRLRLPPRPRLGLPLIRKEVVAVLRTKRAFWLLIFTVGLSSLFSLLVWPSHERYWMGGMETVISTIIFLMTQLTAALLIIPAFAAGAISGEREQGTYELLHATLLAPSSIVTSKVLAAAGYVLLLLLASVPAVTVLHLLGGVTVEGILKCHVITFSAVVMSALVCLWASMTSERTSRAVLKGVVGVVFWNGGLLFLVGLVMAIFELEPRRWSEAIFHVFIALSPHMAVMIQLSGESDLLGGFPARNLAEHAWLAHLAGTSLLSALYFLLLLRRARSPGAASPLAERLAARAARTRRWRPRRPILARVLLGLGAGGGPFGNPVFQKEIRSEFFGRPWYRRTVFAACALIFFGLMAAQSGPRYYDLSGAAGGITGVALFLVAVLSPGVAASAFPREIEQGNIDFLRGTLLPLRTALRGKFLASLYATFGIIAAAFLGIAASVIAAASANFRPRGDRDDWFIPMVLIPAGVLAMTWVFVTAVATLASVLSRRTLGALVGSYAILVAWFAVLPLVWLVATGGKGYEVLIVTHPVGALVSVLDSSKEESVLGFFLLHAGLSIGLWFVSGLAVERLRERDA
jgi:ABC-type transport system involved in multi-copper enzyme maturation permease subunit